RGSLQGSAFAGAAVLTRPGTTAPLFNVAQAGTTQGAFFGPGAAEAAGVLSAFARSGDASRLVAGVFGAKQR
ncbi:MAG: transferrin-binding protein-like solute binding protein, partial [Beijerinckiaceae bacterium]